MLSGGIVADSVASAVLRATGIGVVLAAGDPLERSPRVADSVVMVAVVIPVEATGVVDSGGWSLVGVVFLVGIVALVVVGPVGFTAVVGRVWDVVDGAGFVDLGLQLHEKPNPSAASLVWHVDES